jgi:hypothetical protein
VPPALAHSPRTGDGATDARAGGWDQAAPGATAHPRPAATARTVAAGALLDAPPPFIAADDAPWPGDAPADRFGLRDAAHGVLLAVLAQAAAACLALCVAAGRLLGSGHDGLSLERGSTGPLFLAAGFGFATAAALIGFHAGFNRGRLRHTTIVIALTLAAAWPISGFALPAALIATLAIGLAAAYDRFRAPTRAAPPIPAGALLAIVATGLMVSGLAGAHTRDLHPRPTPTATPGSGEPLLGGPAADGTPSATPRAGIAGGGPAIPSVTPHAKTPAPSPTAAAPTPDTKTVAPNPDAKTASPTPAPEAPAPTPTPAASAPTPHHGSPAPAGTEAPAPAPPAAGPATPATDPTDVVAAYYRALDARRFDQAWDSLSPAVQKAFGGFAHWKAGFATTLESRPEQIVAHSLAGGGVSIVHVLVARDTSACGNVQQRFNVTWRLAPTAGGGWSAASLHAAPLGRPACR